MVTYLVPSGVATATHLSQSNPVLFILSSCLNLIDWLLKSLFVPKIIFQIHYLMRASCSPPIIPQNLVRFQCRSGFWASNLDLGKTGDAWIVACVLNCFCWKADEVQYIPGSQLLDDYCEICEKTNSIFVFSLTNLAFSFYIISSISRVLLCHYVLYFFLSVLDYCFCENIKMCVANFVRKQLLTSGTFVPLFLT